MPEYTHNWPPFLSGGGSSGGITSLNGLTGATQTFAVGTTGTDFAISSSGTVHTFNLPDAGTSARGAVTTGAQTFAGVKTFADNIIIGGGASASELRFLEPSGSGSNYTAFKAQAQAGNVTYTLPAADAAVSGYVLSSNAAGTLSWIAASGGITALSAIGASPNANAATITGSTLNLEPASASFGGVVTTGTQTFAGAKTFSSAPSAPGAGTNSERWGASSLAGGPNGIAVGNSCNTGTGTDNIGIGKSLSINNSSTPVIAICNNLTVPTGAGSSVFIGSGLTLSGGPTQTLGIGAGGTVSGNNAVGMGYGFNVGAECFAIGFTAIANTGIKNMSLGNFCENTGSGGYGLCIGDSAKNNQTGVILIGDYDNSTGSILPAQGNLGVFGWTGQTSTFWIGNFSNAESHPQDIYWSVSPYGSDDTQGDNIHVYAGLNYGANATSGTLYIQTGLQAGASTIQTLVEALTITPIGTAGGVLGAVNSEVIVNNEGRADIDFRVEGDTDANLIFADASADAVQIGGNAPTAFLHLKAGTTAKATARFPASTAPTSPNEGDMWNDSTQKTIQTYASGVKQNLEGVLYSATASATVANTTTETTIIGSGVGTVTLPANFFVAGKTIRVKLYGFHSSVSSATIRIRIKLGSTTILDTGAHTSHNDTNALTEIEGVITCRTTGAGGTVIGQGYYTEVGASPDVAEMVNTATTSINTTTSQAVAVTAQWGTASASNTITITNFTLEVLN